MYSMQATHNKPKILVDRDLKIIAISGRSTSLEIADFFCEVIEEVKLYVQNPPNTTTFNITIEYFNTGSMNYLKSIFRILESSNIEVVVNWYYEKDDEDICELGEEFADIHKKIKFKFIELDT
jgi:hypothetical protein